VRKEVEVEGDCSGADGRGRGSQGGMASEEKKRVARFFDGRRGWVREKKDEWFFHVGPIYRFRIWFYTL